MPEYSDALLLTWQLAAMEANVDKHASIKPGHFFLALCKLCELPLRDMVAQAGDEHLRSCLPQLEAEIGEVRHVFTEVYLDVERFSRSLRTLLGSESAVLADGVMHRDAAARAFCERSKELCRRIAGTQVRPIYLLWALCEREEMPWQALLRDVHVSQQALLTSLAAMVSKREAEDLSPTCPAMEASPVPCRTPLWPIWPRPHPPGTRRASPPDHRKNAGNAPAGTSAREEEYAQRHPRR